MNGLERCGQSRENLSRFTQGSCARFWQSRLKVLFGSSCFRSLRDARVARFSQEFVILIILAT